MAVTRNDLVIIRKTDEIEAVANYIADKRTLFEYPRQGYGGYDKNTHLSKIKAGLLGEIGFFEYLFKFLDKKFGQKPPIERWRVLHEDVQFAYNIVIGKFDDGYEFKLGDLTIDIKTYETNQVSVEQIFKGLKLTGKPLNLLIDCTQNARADIYVQAFILQNGDICLAGYYKGLPPLNPNFPNPAYACSVTDLEPMRNLLQMITDTNCKK